MELNKISLKPKEPIPKLKYNEIGVRSDLKGFQIKNLIDKIIFFLIYKKYSSVILKSRAKGISKLISIIDILQRKILGLYVKQETYSTTYINTQDQNKEIKFPCMDAIFTLKETEGFSQPRNINELESNFIDPKNPPDFRSIKGNNNNYNNNNNYHNYNNNNNYNHYNNNNIIKNRGRDNNNRRVFRPGFRGKFINRGNRGNKNVSRGRNMNNNNYGNNNFRNNNNFNTNYSNNNNNYINKRQNNNYNQGRGFINRGRSVRRIIRGNRGNRGNNNNNSNMIMRYNNVRKDDEDYREFKGYNNIQNNNMKNNNMKNNNNYNNKNNNNNNNYNKNINFNNSEHNFHSTPHFYNSNNLNNNISNQMNNSNSNENLRNNNNSMRGNNMRGMSNLRGRGKVMEMIGRGLPMRGKMNGIE